MGTADALFLRMLHLIGDKGMLKFLRFFGLSLFAWLFLAACSGTTSPPTTPTVEIVPGRPTAPASGDSFREDSPEQVAATGRPQLIEVFAYD
jgi:hypothetical protein